MDTITRRTVLAGGAAGLAALAGCSGDGGEDGNGTDGSGTTTTEDTPTTSTTTTTETTTETTTAQPETLAVENVHLCAEQPGGYRTYTAQPDQTYEPGDVVWVYLEPSTVGTETPGEGERRFEYELTWEVTNPDGESVGSLSDRVEKTVPESADLSEVYLTVNFSPQTEFDEGTHTMEIEVADAIAGNTATETVEFEVESPLEYAPGDFEISTFAFTDGEATDYEDYTPKPDAEYAPDDIVWYYLELDGFAYEATENTLRHDLQIVEILTGPEGDVWSEADLPLASEFEPSVDMDTYHIVYYFEPVDGWMAGDYTVAFEVTDRLTEESFTEEYTFTVVEGSGSS